MLLAPSFHVLQIYDRVIVSKSSSTLLYLSLIAVFALLVYASAEILRIRIAQRLSAKYSIDTSEKIFAVSSRLPNSSGKVDQYLSDYSNVRRFFSSLTFIQLFDMPFIPFYILILFLVHWSVGVLTLFGVAVMILISYANNKNSQPMKTKGNRSEAEAMNFAKTSFQKSEDVSSLGMLPDLISIWGAKTASALNMGDAAGRESAFYYTVGRAWRQFLQIAILGLCAYLVITDDLSAGMIFLSSMVSSKALGPIESVIGSWDQLIAAGQSYENIEVVTNGQRELRRKAELPQPSGYLSATNIIHSINDKAESKIIDSVSISLQPGEIVNLQGTNGCGKSHLLRILAGGLQPSAGEIFLDGTPISHWPSHQWGRTIGFVSQEPSFFPATVAENISRFRSDKPDELIYQASMRSGARELISSLPRGYLTPIGPGGFELSVSQRQVIALARAYYGQPRILLLDEVDAVLDSTAVDNYVKSLQAARKAKLAVFVTSRRKEVVQISDRVIHMNNGRFIRLNITQPTKKISSR